MRYLKLIVTLLITVNICGCNNTSNTNKNHDIQVYQQYGTAAFSTNDGFYHTTNDGFLNFFDYNNKKNITVCSKANCQQKSQLNEQSEARVGTCFGFVNDDALYIANLNNDIENNYTLIKSNLDRSNQIELARFNSNVLRTATLINNKIYFAIDEYRFIENEAGAKIKDSKNKCYLLEIDLDTGKQTKLFTPKQDYNNTITIFGADLNNIYFNYTYFEQEFDSGNLESTSSKSENYVYNLKKEKLTPILKDKYVYTGKIANNKLLTIETSNRESSEIEYTVMEYSLPNYKSKKLAISSEYPIATNSEWIYHDDSINAYYQYNFEKQIPQKISFNRIEGINIYEGAKDYYYISYSKDNQMKKGFILKDDYFKGKKNIIELEEY